MSVYSGYYIVDWRTLTEGYASAGKEFLAEGMDSEADWIEYTEFGGHSDTEYYTSWRMLMRISDWLELDTLRTDANTALAEEECGVFGGADDFVDYIHGLRYLLNAAVDTGRGILIVAA